MGTPVPPDESRRDSGIAVSPPAVTLPRGGGAMRGIGEKFSANPVTGTGAMQIPIATSTGRAGFGPQLALSYDSGAGAGPFGLGWSLSLPTITRKTDKGIPTYDDSSESDVFIASGTEDLVPVLVRDAEGAWVPEPVPPRVVDDVTYHIERYRPRVERDFARIERWTNSADAADCFWRSISRDDVTSWYGRTAESRIADPSDASRIFSWLLCETYDDKGNAIVYRYKAEDSEKVEESLAHERNRTAASRGANRYLQRILYANRVSYLPQLEAAAPWPVPAGAFSADHRNDWLFEVAFDYGDYDPVSPSALDEGRWNIRDDPFSSYRSGFDVRTYRLCRRVLLFHHFAGEPGVDIDCLVRSTDLSYSLEAGSPGPGEPMHSTLASVSQSGYRRQSAGGGYLRRSMPPLELSYTRATIDERLHEVDRESAQNLPEGVDGARYQWIDLDGEGLPGVLTEQGAAWFYKRNISALPIDVLNGAGDANSATDADGRPRPFPRFGAVERLVTMPSPRALSEQQLMDVAGDGQLDVVQLEGPVRGFFERDGDAGWNSFVEFAAMPNVAWRDPNLRLVDLTGDGRADVLITDDEAFTWYPSLGEEGFGNPERVSQPRDEEQGPRLVFADAGQSIHLADLSGDGLTDLVRIRNGEVCYWPNLGHGRFGKKITMDRAPWFDRQDQFDQKRLRLADVDGSGTTDILYLANDEIRIYFNRSGNSWSSANRLTTLPRLHDLSSVTVADILGNGTACLVWSSPMPGDAGRPLRYIDLMGGEKPHLLVKLVNNLGAETQIDYAPSTRFYLADRFAGRPWATRLPFPVHVVERVTLRDKWRRTEFSSTYSYHHGFFDGIEREFRGFGRVDQVDVERFDKFAAGNIESPYVTDDQSLYQPPVKTVTWFHTGAVPGGGRVLSQYADEYFPVWFEALRPDQRDVLGGFREKTLAEPDFDAERLSGDEWREALRACKGMMLRQEVYELDVDVLHARGAHRPVKLFSTAYHNCQLRLVQPRADNEHAVFHVMESEALTYGYDLDLRSDTVTPDPRVGHTLNLRLDKYGNVEQSLSVAYPRIGEHLADDLLSTAEVALIRQVQGEMHVGYVETRYTEDVVGGPGGPDRYRLRIPFDVRTFDVTRIAPASADGYFTLGELRNYLLSSELQPATPPTTGVPYEAVGELAYHELPGGAAEKRLVEHLRTLFFADNLQSFLPLGTQGTRALLYEKYQLALTAELLDAVFDARLDEVIDGAVTARELIDGVQGGYISGTQLAARFAPTVPAARLAGQYWIRSGIPGYAPDAAQHFYRAERYTDAFGNLTRVELDPYALFVARSTDPVGNTVEVTSFDFRVLAPRRLRDANGNLSALEHDTLGMVVASAVMGKGTEGDTLAGFTSALLDPSPRSVATFCTAAALDVATARSWLRGATTRFVYHLGEARNAAGDVVAWGVRPAGTCAIRREIHASVPGGATSPLQVALECFDGLGEPMMTKRQAEPAQAGGPPRWIVDGKTVLNNKGTPVKQYEPYFSGTFGCEEVDAVGVTPLLYYDSVGRLVRREFADGSVTATGFGPWHTTVSDANDTVLEPGNVWYARSGSAAAPQEERRAAALAARHAGTPGVTVLDALGRAAITIAHNREDDGVAAPADVKYLTHTRLDAEGKLLWVRDPRRNLVTQHIRPPMPDGQQADSTTGFVPCYDVAGNQLFRHTMDAGDRWTLYNAAGGPAVEWDVNERQTTGSTMVTEARVRHTRYDALHRPTEQWLTVNSGATQMVEQLIYGESAPAATDRNLRDQLWRHYDASGRVELERLDFKGNVLETQRRLALDYEAAVIDWQSQSDTKLLSETFYKVTEYDALDRVNRLYNWHRGPGSRVAVYEPRYGERGLLQSEELVMRATKTANGYTPNAAFARQTPIVRIEYDAKGQKELIRHGNGTSTRYAYSPLTFRLVQQRTTRSGYVPAFPNQPASLKDARVLQNLFHTYDAAGNITAVRDDAFEPAFFQNQQVDAVSRYRYDALYQLVEASGRESAQATGGPSEIEAAPQMVQFPATAKTLRNYTEWFEYDAAGNRTSTRHVAGGVGDWTRRQEYAMDSNHLQRSWFGTDRAAATQFRYDRRGNMLNLANAAPTRNLRWSYRDMVRALDFQGGGWAYYNYDSAKQRTRKVLTSQNGTRQSERFDLGGVEIYRRYSGGNVVEEIETVHLLESDERILLVEDVLSTDRAALPTGPLYRFQYNNQVKSACLEVDQQARILSFEEFHPFGTSAYRARNRAVETPPKRYRFSGMERDTESGLSCHGARYYAPWLARWVSTDPLELAGGLNRYRYVRNRPTALTDQGGTIDDEGKKALQGLQELVDQIPQKEFKRLNRSERGGRAHLTLESILHVDLRSPARTTGGMRLAPEMIVDVSGKIIGFGDPGKFGRAMKDGRTIDVALLKQSILDLKDLIGKQASEVIEVALDYKTGAAKLKGVGVMEELIKAPYVKIAQKGDVLAAAESKLAKFAKDAPKSAVAAVETVVAKKLVSVESKVVKEAAVVEKRAVKSVVKGVSALSPGDLGLGGQAEQQILIENANETGETASSMFDPVLDLWRASEKSLEGEDPTTVPKKAPVTLPNSKPKWMIDAEKKARTQPKEDY
jgi:RHS repeat-associated protein